MKKKRHTESEIFKILKQAESGDKVQDVCRKYNISTVTLYRWKSKYSGMKLSDIKKMKALEIENSRLKSLVAKYALENEAIKEVLEKYFERLRIAGLRAAYRLVVERGQTEELPNRPSGLSVLVSSTTESAECDT